MQQQSTDPHYFEMANYQNDIYQQMTNPIIKPIVPQTIQINSTNESDPVNQLKIRKAFLTKYYIKQIVQLLGITLIYGINQIRSFSSIYLSEVDRDWWGSHYTYQKFQEYASHETSHQEFHDWMEVKRREYMDYKFNWVYYFILTLTILFSLFIAYARNYRFFAQYQGKFFLIQTILLGFVLGGASSVYKQNWQYDNLVLYTVLSLSGLNANAIFNLVLIKINKIEINGKLLNIFTYLFFGLNFLMGLILKYQQIEGLPIVEFVALYFFFYFNQLNKSLLLQPSELPPTKNLIDIFRNIQTELNENQIKSNQHFLVINKKILTIIAIVFGLILLELCGYLISTFAFILISVLSGLAILSFGVPTQVAQQTLQIEDVDIAVMTTYLDILSPIQNLVRQIKI